MDLERNELRLAPKLFGVAWGLIRTHRLV